MQANALSHEQYEQTMKDMKNISDTVIPIVDIWPYVKQLVSEYPALEYFYEHELAEFVYASTLGYDHILIPINEANEYIVIIVDNDAESIYGHYLLDLNEQYGIGANSE